MIVVLFRNDRDSICRFPDATWLPRCILLVSGSGFFHSHSTLLIKIWPINKNRNQFMPRNTVIMQYAMQQCAQANVMNRGGTHVPCFNSYASIRLRFRYLPTRFPYAACRHTALNPLVHSSYRTFPLSTTHFNFS